LRGGVWDMFGRFVIDLERFFRLVFGGQKNYEKPVNDIEPYKNGVFV